MMERSGRRTGHGRILALAVLAAFLPVSAGAVCDPAICVGDTVACSITGTHVVDDGCTLDFGGRNVTVTGAGVVQSASPGASFAILARDLVVQGILLAPGSSAADPSIDVMLAGSLRTESIANSPGTIDVTETDATGAGWLRVVASGDVTLAGKDVTADGGPSLDGGVIEITAASIRVAGPVHANAASSGEGSGGEIILIALDGELTIQGAVAANGAGNDSYGGIILIASEAGAVSILASVSAMGNGGGDGGYVETFADAGVTISGVVTVNGAGGESSGGVLDVFGARVDLQGSLTANAGNGGVGGDVFVAALAGTARAAAGSTMSAISSGGGAGGIVVFEASEDVAWDGNVLVSASGIDAEGGFIFVGASPTGTVTIGGTLDATVPSNRGGADGTIEIGEACTVRISGALESRNPSLTDGTNVITYRGTLDVSGGTLLADGTGGNVVQCRCVLAPDGTCDLPLRCVQDPIATGATITPVLQLVPIALGDCRCGDGAIDSPGEECDDGNFSDGDCCSRLCRLDPPGTACGGDGNSCTDDVCDGAGTCQHLERPDGSSCDDGNQCTEGDVCAAGACEAPVRVCNDCCVERWQDGSCEVPACADCVCAFAPQCCSHAWTGLCVLYASSICSGECPVCPTPMPTPDPLWTPTPLATSTVTPTATPSPTPTVTATVTPTVTPTPVDTVTPTTRPTTTETDAPAPTTTPPGLPACGTTPEAGCRTPTLSGKALVQLKAGASDTKDALVWKWLGGTATLKAEFGDPTAMTSYRLCVYDGSARAQPILSAAAPSAGACAGKPCWTERTSGFRYVDKNLTSNGLSRVQMVAGGDGRARIVLKGKGAGLAMPSPLAIESPVTVQLRNSEGACWEATYDTPAIRSDPSYFKDKAD